MLREVFGIADDEIQNVRWGAFKLLFGILGFVFLGWLINIVGYKEMNFILLACSILLVLAVLSSPKLVYASFGLGALVAELRDQDITQGSVGGVITLYRIAVGVLFWMTVVSALLATWSFEHSPKAFIAIATLLLTLLLMFEHFGIKTGKWTVLIIGAYVVIMVLAYMWGTFSPETRGKAENLLYSTDTSAERPKELPTCWVELVDGATYKAAPDCWTVWTKKTDWCPGIYDINGLEIRDTKTEYRFLSRSGTREVKAFEIGPGKSLPDYPNVICPSS